MTSTLAIGVAALKARRNRIRETPQGATIVCASRDEAEIMRDHAQDMGRYDIIYTTKADQDRQAEFKAIAKQREQEARDRASRDLAERIAQEFHADGGLVDPSHPLKELEGTW